VGGGGDDGRDGGSEMSLMFYNAMWEGFAQQIDAQLGRRIFEHPLVAGRFPGMTRRPRLVAVPVEKTIPLNLLSQFVAQIAPHLPMDDADMIAIRRKSGFLPESLPEVEEDPEPEPEEEADEEEPEGEPEAGEEEAPAEEEDKDGGGAEMMYRAVSELLTELRSAVGLTNKGGEREQDNHRDVPGLSALGEK